MRHLAILLAALPLSTFAQPVETDRRVMQTLLAEVQQLRVAIERSTLLGTRTQIALSQLQLQETRATRLSKEVADLREANGNLSGERTRLTEAIKDAEGARSQPKFAAPQAHDELESHIKDSKRRLEQLIAQEQRQAAREGELAAQLRAAEREVTDSRSRIAEMERVLDSAIQQMLKPR